MNGILIALIGLIAAFVGGAIQAYATNRFEKSKFEREAKWQLYSAYFVTLGELSFTARDKQRHTDALARMANIRGQIGIQGSPQVIEAVGQVFRHPDLLREAQSAMAKALRAMREDLGKTDNRLTEDAMVQLMFGSREF
ncbi:hypothetical protein [Altererythrobacter aquiaggeris]|uniref:hypothetical protein n=1 Tax=Aestuarierythrobacter aquiaggeris TaxID=1898396 RepID=UPI003015C4D9